jgi:HAD superfamily hydrolase (TIGR01450 family)
MLVDDYDAFLVDLDGVVYVGDEPVPGAVDAIERLRDRAIPVRFVTNNSSRTRDEIRTKLAGMGIDASRQEIVSAAWATGEYLRDRGLETVSVVGTGSLRAELERGGVVVADDAVDAVVVGHDDTTEYADLTRATRLVHRHDVPLVAVNADAVVPQPDGPIPGVGAIASAIETATNRTATVIGKPERRLFDYALASLETDSVAMIGDTPTADVAGASRAGIDAILVTAHAVRSTDGPTPDATISGLADLFEE